MSRVTLPFLLLLAVLVPAPAAHAHGPADHGERLLDGRLVEVPVEGSPAPSGTRASRTSRTTRGWRATGPRSLAIVQILMPGRNASQYPQRTDSELRSAFAGASGALTEMTDGTVSLREGGPVVTTTATTSGNCAWSTWADEGVAALTAAGVDPAPYLTDGNVAYVLVGPTGCGWAGLAYLPGNEIWLDNTLSRRITVHELGHNFGLHHAATRRCTSGGAGVLTSSSCTVTEYGDAFDPMGSADRHFSAAHKRQGGWMPAAHVRSVTANGTFSLGAASDTAAGTRLLAIPRPDGTQLTVELRRPFGVDAFGATDPVVSGVSLRLWRSSSIDLTQLLDSRPETSTFWDAALPAGRTVTDAAAGISVTLNALSGGAATVSVDLRGLGADVTAPDAPVVDALAGPDGTLGVSWAAAADDVQTIGYRVLRDGVQVAQLGAEARAWSEGGLASGAAHEYAVVAFDAAGNARSSGAVRAVVPGAADPSPPAADAPAPSTPPAPAPAPAAPPAPCPAPAPGGVAEPPAVAPEPPATKKKAKRRATYRSVRRCKRVRREGRVRKLCWRVKVRVKAQPRSRRARSG